jgi:hypothetical protein
MQHHKKENKTEEMFQTEQTHKAITVPSVFMRLMSIPLPAFMSTWRTNKTKIWIQKFLINCQSCIKKAKNKSNCSGRSRRNLPWTKVSISTASNQKASPKTHFCHQKTTTKIFRTASNKKVRKTLITINNYHKKGSLTGLEHKRTYLQWRISAWKWCLSVKARKFIAWRENWFLVCRILREQRI